MGQSALAYEDKNAYEQNAAFSHRFDSLKATSFDPSTLPKPCARAYFPQTPKSASLSSAGYSDGSTPPSSMELEKSSWDEHDQKLPSRDSRRSTRSLDPEKSAHDSRHISQRSHGSEMATRITYDAEDEEVDEARQTQEKKIVKILLFMSGPCVLLSAMNAAWACVAIVITLLSQPIRLCAKRPTIGQQLAGLLSPTLNLQLRSIYTPLPPYANEDGSYNSFNLFTGHILSPFLSFALMFAAWTLAVYWATSAVVGDPSGQDKRDDGKETVLGLRKWWEKWLLRGVKHEQ